MLGFVFLNMCFLIFSVDFHLITYLKLVVKQARNMYCFIFYLTI